VGKTYTNEIDVSEVSLGITHLLIAPKSTSWTPGRINISTPPTSFVWTGAVVEDSPQLTVTREKFQLKTGIPRVTQYEQIMAVDGVFKCMLHSKDWDKWMFALGNTVPDTTNWASTPGTANYVIQYYGTRQQLEYVGIGVTDFIDGTQIVHHFHRMVAASEIEEAYKADQEGRVPLNYNLLAKKITLSGADELVVATKYTFGPDGTGV
jgi:hypothetical protein